MSDVPPCTFCGKAHNEVRRLIIASGWGSTTGEPRYAICDECVCVNMEILANESAAIRDEFVARMQAIEPINSN
jgi:ATP-dependent protease Clp ATPase subunit